MNHFYNKIIQDAVDKRWDEIKHNFLNSDAWLTEVVDGEIKIKNLSIQDVYKKQQMAT